MYCLFKGRGRETAILTPDMCEMAQDEEPRLLELARPLPRALNNRRPELALTFTETNTKHG